MTALDPTPSGAPSDSSAGALSEDARRALAGGAAPRRFGAWYVAEHRIRAMRGYLQSAIVTSIGNPLVYLFALGIGLASLVPQGVGEVSYLVFVAPALLATAAVTVAADETTYPMLAGFKWNPVFFGMNASPVTGTQISAGIMIAITVRLLATVAIYFAVMLLFGAVPLATGVLAIPVAVGTGLAVGGLIGAYASRIEDDRGQLPMLMRFGVTPMFLFSGTFFPLETLPPWLQWIGWVSPLWHGSELGRVVSYGYDEPAWLTAVHVVYLAVLIVVGLRLVATAFTRRLNK